MKAITDRRGLPLSDPHCFALVEKDAPVPRPRDLVVSVRAVSVNPVDTKLRGGQVDMGGAVDVLGFDAAGVVVATGPDATLFRPGDEVFYSGDLTRPGANAELHAVDERLVGRKPKKLDVAQAAALPLTAITAWELLFERLMIGRDARNEDGTLLVIGGAGGVGSMLIQLARALTRLTVIATASRPESRKWCLSLGAHHVIDHTGDLRDEITALGPQPVTHVAALNRTDRHWPAIAEIIAPYGKIGVITNHTVLDAVPLRAKSASLHWEDIVTRVAGGGEGLSGHHAILNEIAALVDADVLRSTLALELGPLSPATLAEAHALVENGRMIGKVVLPVGF
jgi:zinc-binding alcohol dehydrogenase family protein